jgi:CO/xanthine dehydrogenase FAD-binding subunit
MRGYLPAYDLRVPKDLSGALRTLADDPGAWRPFAGGTDLMVLLDAGKLPGGGYLSLWNLNELRGIDVSHRAVTIGALTTYADVLADPVLRAEFPLLCQAAAETGGVATQNRGTLGGNIANASPAADSPPALLVYDAELELISMRGARRVPYERFHSGYKVMDLAPDELVSSIRIPRGRSDWIQSYRKVGTRRAQAISKVCFAATAALDGGVVREIRLALGSVAPTVVRCVQAESAVRGRRLDDALVAAARDALPRDINPIDDLRSTARYRLRVAQNLLIQFLEALSGRTQE